MGHQNLKCLGPLKGSIWFLFSLYSSIHYTAIHGLLKANYNRKAIDLSAQSSNLEDDVLE